MRRSVFKCFQEVVCAKFRVISCPRATGVALKTSLKIVLHNITYWPCSIGTNRFCLIGSWRVFCHVLFEKKNILVALIDQLTQNPLDTRLKWLETMGSVCWHKVVSDIKQMDAEVISAYYRSKSAKKRKMIWGKVIFFSMEGKRAFPALGHR